MDVLARVFDPTILERALTWEMPAFLRVYTLHDSVFEELRHSPRGGIAVSVDWDFHWNPGIPAIYQKLVIVFPLPYSLTWRQGPWYYATLDGAASELISAADRERFLSSINIEAFQNDSDEIQPCAFDESLTRTDFQGINWSRITILHNSAVRFLCFDESGSLFLIPKVAAE